MSAATASLALGLTHGERGALRDARARLMRNVRLLPRGAAVTEGGSTAIMSASSKRKSF
jgi:hypothetical protein